MKTAVIARTIASVSLTVILLVTGPAAFSQSAYTPDVGNVGLPANGVFSGGSVDTVQLNNGNLHIDIPLLHLPGIGLDTDIHLTYDSQVWNRAVGSISASDSAPWTLITWSRAPWQTKDPIAGFLKWGQHTLNWNCALITGSNIQGTTGSDTDIDFMGFTDGNGTAHSLPVQGLLPNASYPQCASSINGVVGTWPAPDTTGDAYNGYFPVYSADQSGYRLVVDSNGNVVNFSDKHGTKYTFASQPAGTASALPAQLVGTPESYFGASGEIMNPGGATNIEYLPIASLEDADGNRITSSSNSSGVTITDTVGRAITETYSPQTSKCGASDIAYGQSITSESLGNMPSSIAYTDQNNDPQTIYVCYGVAQASLNLFCGGAASCSTKVGVNNPSGSVGIVVPTSIILQNGDTYTFSYNPNGDPNYMGEITSITLPTGGTISYTYGTYPAGYPVYALSGRQVFSRTVTENGQTSTWNYNYAYNSLQVGGGGELNYNFLTTTVTDPNLNDTVFTCNNNPTNLPVGEINWNAPCSMTNEVSYSGSASSQNQIATKSTGYTFVGTSLGAYYYAPVSDVLTWNSSGATTETDTTWDSFHPPTAPEAYSISLGNVMSKKVHDYGAGSPGTLLRNTQYTYLHQNSQNNSPYLTPNILDRVAQVSVYNSASALVAQTTTAYDSFTNGGQSGLAAPGWTTQHDSAFGSSYALRGLPTSATKYSGPSSSPSSASIVTYTNYNILGQPTVSTDGRGNHTSFTYTNAATPPSNTDSGAAFLITTTMPSTGSGVSHVTKQYEDVNTGLSIANSDQNTNLTEQTYDSRMRPLVTTRPPGGGSTTNSYPTPNQVISVVKEDAQRTAMTTVTLDGLGRKISTGTTSDATCGPLTVDTGYDSLGRVQWVSNPHCLSTQVTDGYTTYTYDAIGRLINKQNPDGFSAQKWSFPQVPSVVPNVTAFVSKFVDETGRTWEHLYDAEGRLTFVLEPDGSPNIGNAPTLETDYSYDTLNNLLQVKQCGALCTAPNGPVYRSFAYDAASRLLASNNPENASAQFPASQTCAGTASGTKWATCYSLYDGNGNLGQKTDNRGTSIYYSYDNLNRLTTKTYSDSTPPVAFTYDTTTLGGANDTGEMTQATVTSGSTVLAQTSPYNYDAMGRLLNERQCTPATTNCSNAPNVPNPPYSLAYAYDFMGKPTSMTFPSNPSGNGAPFTLPLTLTYSYDQAERLLTAASNWVAIGDANHPGTLFQGSANSGLPAYGPMGLLNASIGVNSSTGATAATIQHGYDMRGRTVNGIYAAGGGAITDSRSAGSITISGNEASPVTKTTAPSSMVLTNTVGKYGSAGTTGYWYCPEGTCSQGSPGYLMCQPNYYAGNVQIVIQSTPAFSVSASWGGPNANPSVVSSTLISELNASGSPVTINPTTGVVTSVATGSSTNYPVSVSLTQFVQAGTSYQATGNPPQCN